MKVLVLSHIYPRPFGPDGAPSISRQVAELARRDVDLRVLSPVPLAPPLPVWNGRLRQALAASRATPREWTIDGVSVLAPRFLKFPGALDFGQFGPLYWWSVRRLVHHIHREWRFDLIHGQMLVPDGYAAVKLGNELGVPSVATERGYLSTMARGWRQRRPLSWVITNVGQCVFVA